MNHKKPLLFVVFGFVLFVRGFPNNQGPYVIEEILEADDEIVDEEINDGLLRGGLNDTAEAQSSRVLYTGSQVWKVKIENSKQLRVLSEIRKQKGTICVSVFF